MAYQRRRARTTRLRRNDGDTGNENAYKFTDPNPVDIFGMAGSRRRIHGKMQEGQKAVLHSIVVERVARSGERQQGDVWQSTSGHCRARNPKQITTAAITEDLDTGVGVVLQAIDRLGLADNTYVIYMADNGAGGRKRGGTAAAAKGASGKAASACR